jgi:hypothetical protein
MRDSEGNQIDLAHLPDDLTTVKPTETFGRGDKGKGKPTVRDDISRKEMTDFRDEFKQEGMQAMWASNVGRDIKQNLGNLAFVYRETMAEGVSAPNQTARRQAVDFWRKATQSYFDDIDNIEAVMADPAKKQATFVGIQKQYSDDLQKSIQFKTQLAAAGEDTKGISSRIDMLQRRLKNIGNMGSNKRRQKLALENFAKYEHEMSWKTELRDINAVISKPNQNIRNMLLGQGLANQ